jgi:DNA-binding response OmpR family regulator
MKSLSVLVVAPTPHLAANLMDWLTEAGCAVMLVTSFAAGKARLDQHPSILISEVRLGDYNGLHLALRAKAIDIPSIVLGRADAVLQREAQRLGVIYFTDELDRAQVLSIVRNIERAAEKKSVDSTHGRGLAFLSWDELVPTTNPRDESPSSRRRALRS